VKNGQKKMVVFTAPLNPSFPPGTEIPQSVIKVIEDLPRTNSLTVAEAIDKIHKQMKEERIAITKAIQDSYIKSIIISEVSSKKWYTLAYGDNLDNKSLMEITEQIDKFGEFFDLIYKDHLHQAVSRGEKHLSVNFSDISRFNIDLAQDIIENPEDTIRAAEIALEKFDIKDFRIRIRNLPKTQQIMIRDIRSSHLNNFIQVIGIIRQKSDVRPQVTSARFECPSCGNTLTVLQLDTKFREPTKCACGRKGKFKLLSKEMIDAQKIVLEESPEELEGSEQPKRLDIFLKADLVSPMSEKKTNPGSKNIVTGILKEVPIIARDGGKLTRFDLMLEANHVESVAEDFSELDINQEEIKEIKELSEDPKLYKKLVNSIAPSIYGHEKVKEALLLQLFGGVRKRKDDGSITRGDVHVLLIGDPGCIAGDSRVALYYKGMEKIINLGKEHLQSIKEIVTKIRKDSKEKGL